MNVTLREITANDPSLEADLYPLLAALRPGLSVDTFDTLLSEGREQGLRVLIADQGADRCIGAALYRIVATSRGRVTFLDDLVTNPARRSKGVGAALFAEVERRGRAAGCERLELDSGVNNQSSHRFYHRHGLRILALHFAKELESA
ncbi:MAG: GNAT family N-acetyltransferase [Steroidobacteraceae bacterium]